VRGGAVRLRGVYGLIGCLQCGRGGLSRRAWPDRGMAIIQTFGNALWQ
jgi:hypothetical protein